MKTCLVLGSSSDIAKQLMPFLARHWNVVGWRRCEDMPKDRWDVCLITIGTVAPVGLWHDVPADEWLAGIDANLCEPFMLLRSVWHTHKQGATVCFFAGSNPNMIMSGYSAYNCSKMGLLKLVEQLDHETPDAKFFALGPGTVLTKIHKATLDAKWDNPKLKAAMEANKPANMERMARCIEWAVDQPKTVIGGRNLCVSDPWDEHLAGILEDEPSLFKLRRNEGS